MRLAEEKWLPFRVLCQKWQGWAPLSVTVSWNSPPPPFALLSSSSWTHVRCRRTPCNVLKAPWGGVRTPGMGPCPGSFLLRGDRNTLGERGWG